MSNVITAGALTRTSENPFTVAFKPCAREPQSFKDELYAAARTIAASATQPIWLAYSGRLESTVMLRAFADQGIHVHALILIDNRTPPRAVDAMRKLCDSYAIETFIRPFSHTEFYSRDIPRYRTEGYLAARVIRYYQIKIMEIVKAHGGTAVIGSGDLKFQMQKSLSNPTLSQAHFNVSRDFFTPLEWVARNGHHHPYFFFSTPELCASYLQLPLIAVALQHAELLRHTSSISLLRRASLLSSFPETRPTLRSPLFLRTDANYSQSSADLKSRSPNASEMYHYSLSAIRADLADTAKHH